MTYRNIQIMCSARAAIYRQSNPGKRYWKSYTGSFSADIPEEDKKANDWQVYDPRENPENMAHGEDETASVQ